MSNEQEQQNEGGKVTKKFDVALKRLYTLLGERKGMLDGTPKIAPDAITAAIAELAKEEKEELIKQFKTKAVELIKKKKEFDAFVKTKEAELKKSVQEEQKKFTTQAEGLFGLMQRSQDIEKDYAKVLGAAEEGVSSEEEETDGADK